MLKYHLITRPTFKVLNLLEISIKKLILNVSYFLICLIFLFIKVYDKKVYDKTYKFIKLII
jgi:hypothetical protein